MPQVAPYGGWRSPIDANALAAAATPLLDRPQLVGDSLYWVEGKPSEGGRSVIVRRDASGTHTELTPRDFNVRTRVHEYGGGAYVVNGSSVYFANFADQRLYRQDGDGPPQPITPSPQEGGSVRYADARITRDGRSLICVREIHAPDGGEPVNELAVLPTDGSTAPRTVASGHDFYAAPRISPDGRQLVWLTWDHPQMPWDGTELWIADFGDDGSLGEPRRVAGGPGESVFQPSWSPDGRLHFVSDRTGWWNLYRLDGDEVQPLAPADAEFGVPHWQFGASTYAFLSDGRIVAICSREGIDRLLFLSEDGAIEFADHLPYTSFDASLTADGDIVVFVAASPTDPAALIRLDASSGTHTVLRRSSTYELAPSHVSRPQVISYPSAGRKTFALYYPPTNADFVAPADERPPLIVVSHGGPTGMAMARFTLQTQYWTTRGFAVVDVNYGGSAGFGRAYRERLKGAWGVVDTEDCITAARYLAAEGHIDPQRLAIRGGSAGGYTTLCALVFHDDFAVGASYYGVADCEALATDTHKFESRYLDGLIGPYPAARELYRKRSPIHYADRLSCPVILLQGLEDKVVPPSQAETFVHALREKRLPFAYLAFEGEQHGFRQAKNIERSFEAELYFYSKILGFGLPDPIEPVEIENVG